MATSIATLSLRWLAAFPSRFRERADLFTKPKQLMILLLDILAGRRLLSGTAFLAGSFWVTGFHEAALARPHSSATKLAD
jgi:hypothetical protein